MGFYAPAIMNKASKCHDDSAMRMCYQVAATCCVFNNVTGRISKPFNSMLGETYEFVSPTVRYMSELVCHHPPIFAF